MFISVIIAILVCNGTAGQRVHHCNQKKDKANYMKCLTNWRVVKEENYSAFLKDKMLIDEICIYPEVMKVTDMDKCVVRSISPYCDYTAAHWKGLKQFVTYICKYREDFQGTHARCRTSKYFQTAYEKCMADHYREMHVRHVMKENTSEMSCRVYQELDTCLKNALEIHCASSAKEFFELAFSYRDDPLRAITCKGEEESVPDYVFNTGETKAASNEIETQSTDNSPIISRHVEFTEESLAVNESNGSDVLFAHWYCIFVAYMWKLFISYLLV